MKHLTKSLEAFKKYLEITPKAEIEASIAAIDKLDFGGPTLDQYLEQLQDSLQLSSWLENWPSSPSQPEGNWGFEPLTKVQLHAQVVVCASTSQWENAEYFVETSICEAA